MVTKKRLLGGTGQYEVDSVKRSADEFAYTGGTNRYQEDSVSMRASALASAGLARAPVAARTAPIGEGEPTFAVTPTLGQAIASFSAGSNNDALLAGTRRPPMDAMESSEVGMTGDVEAAASLAQSAAQLPASSSLLSNMMHQRSWSEGINEFVGRSSAVSAPALDQMAYAGGTNRFSEVGLLASPQLQKTPAAQTSIAGDDWAHGPSAGRSLFVGPESLVLNTAIDSLAQAMATFNAQSAGEVGSMENERRPQPELALAPSHWTP